jgi:hypothetical protein
VGLRVYKPVEPHPRHHFLLMYSLLK